MLLEETEARAAAAATTPAENFRLYFYAAVLRLLEHCSRTFDTWEAVFAEHPFLLGYYQELMAHGLEGMALEDACDFWRRSIHEREEATEAHLPVRALREAAG